MRKFVTGSVLLVVLMAATALAGCGSTGSGATTRSGDGQSAAVQAAKAQSAKLLKGTYESPPSTAPAPPSGKSVWFLSCSQAVSLCAEAGAAVKEAGSLVGWKTTIFDTRSEPNLMAEGVRQAITAKVDAIVLYAQPCSTGKQPLEEAKAAGIKIIGVESYDCNQTTSGAVETTSEPPLFDGQVTYVDGDYAHYIVDYARGQANWLIDKTDGSGEIVSFIQTDSPLLSQYNDAYKAQIARCPECTLKEVAFGFADYGPELQQKAQQALLSAPNATGVMIPYDAITTSGVGAALESSGKEGQLAIIGGEGEPANMALVRAGRQQDAGIGLAPAWEGWSAVDGLIRIFDGQEPVDSGIGLQIYEKGHNAPPQGGYVPPIDFKAAYRKAWGVG
ncbi:MAG: substrate-binding domain-containing protein [Actinobacteria bacterium]|nr:substrate-binding domain-containing protein [Actinomycetota bacterium]